VLDPLAGFKGGRFVAGRENGKGWGKGGERGGERGEEEGRREGREREGMEEERGKGDRGNGRYGTGHGMGPREGKGGMRRKGGEGLQPPNFNSWRRHCLYRHKNHESSLVNRQSNVRGFEIYSWLFLISSFSFLMTTQLIKTLKF